MKLNLRTVADRFLSAINLPPIQVPKVKGKMASLPGYTTASSAKLKTPELNLANQDLTATYRNGSTTGKVIRDLVRVSPDLSAGVSAHLRVGLPENYKVSAYNPDGSINREATLLAAAVIQRFDYLPDYATGFATASTIRSVCEALGKELIQEGGCAVEVVLDKSKFPARFQPVAVSTVKFYPDKEGTLKPVQVINGEEYDLDIPTFIYTALDQSLLTAYAISPLESAVQPVLASMTFLSDLRKVCARHVHPRYDISINEEKLRAKIPAEIATDQVKLNEFLNTVLQEVEDMINGLGVEEALIHYDFIIVKFVEGANGDIPNTFDTVKSIYDAKIATGSRVLPSILGHGSGSQNIASTETMMFMLTANGLVRLKVQEVMSKAMTISLRLLGHDVVVKFEFDSINLRPERELEAFKAMEVSRVTDLLSLGFISDDQACLMLTGRVTPDGYTPKSGTMFKEVGQPTAANPYSGTSTGAGGGAMNQSLKPSTPQKPKS